MKFIRSCGVRIEIDTTLDDDGVFLWNANGFHNYEELELLIEKLKMIKEELHEVRKR